MYTGFSPVLLKQHAKYVESEEVGKGSDPKPEKLRPTIMTYDTFEAAVDGTLPV